MHIDLIKLQAEFGARHSYRKAAYDLKSLTGKDRSINNHSRVHRMTKLVGNTLSEHTEDEAVEDTGDTSEPLDSTVAKELCGVADGGYVHDALNKGHNFEAMTAKIYRPENVIRIDKHHTKITQKHCAASAYDDKQETMKRNIIAAAKKECIDKKTTKLTVLADGASNCWNVLTALIPFCLTITFILDWFHIGKYIKRIRTGIPKFDPTFKKIRGALWYGEVEVALSLIRDLIEAATDTEHIRRIQNFYDYIYNNKTKIVNYNERREKSLPYSSHVAESTVEHLLNERSKRKQKMQWSREGLHAVLQIRVSQCSNDWEDDWSNIIKPALQTVA